MKHIEKFRLDTIVKLSIIALAIAGIYYFVTAAQSKNNSQAGSQLTKGALSAGEEIAWKQKCRQVGEEYFKTLQEKWPPFYDQYYGGLTVAGGPEFAYNSSLNTCLISYELSGPGDILTGPQNNTSMDAAIKKSGYRNQYYIFDTLAMKQIAGCYDFSSLIPKKENSCDAQWLLHKQNLMVNNSK